MIVLDENLHDQRIVVAIAGWYAGQVVSIRSLRPGTVIKDEAIPVLLLGEKQPTFLTINLTDFWRRVAPHSGYCVMIADLPKERIRELPGLVRRAFAVRPFRTRALRMGKIVRLSTTRIAFYENDRRVRSLPWEE